MQEGQDERWQHFQHLLAQGAGSAYNLRGDCIQIREEKEETESEEDRTYNRLHAPKGCVPCHHAGLLRTDFLAPQ